MHALQRKFRQFRNDPVLRSWWLRRAIGLVAKPAPFAPHLPPYAWERLPLKISAPGLAPAPETISDVPAGPSITLPLAGIGISFDPADASTFFSQAVDDIEVDLARHRFAWLPLCPDTPAGVFRAMWQTWRQRYFASDGMHWHPYTAAERAINVLDATGRLGAPDTPEKLAADLAQHAVVISERLEYFGDHDTSNHLANNGRGLYRIGCALGDESTRLLGFDILINEARRILLSCGMLREGSSHYHLLYLRNYLDVWMCATRHGFDDEASALKDIAARMMGAARQLVLGGGMPLIGDISPDVPPSFLAGLENGTSAWTTTLSEEQRHALHALSSDAPIPSADAMLNNGWMRADFGRWSALAHVPPSGWPFMPGHAHQDMGSVDIHIDGKPLFVDPGRGTYGETGDAALYRGSAVHGGLRIDGADPYPPNKPYYDDAFRARHAGTAAAMMHADGFTIAHGGYKRLGISDVRRRWQFSETEIRIEDGISGDGGHRIERAFVTPLDVHLKDNGVIIDNRFTIICDDATPRLDPVIIWRAYNDGVPGTRIVFEVAHDAPWASTIFVRATI